MSTQDQIDFTMHVNLEKINEAYKRLSCILKKTPVHTSHTIDKLVGKNVFFKCENFQKTGAFKARGALNAVLVKFSNKESLFKGAVTHSSGNHGINKIIIFRINRFINNLFELFKRNGVSMGL
jgi:threonine dehydratase